MRKLLALGAVALVAGCGGGSSKPAKPGNPSESSAGGMVTAEPTKGVLLPAVSVLDGKERSVGRTGPISPKDSRPTDAQQNGVGGAGRCVRTSANPSPANLAALSGAILCLLNSERAAKGLPPVHANRKLRTAARGWANRMVAGRFFAHEAGNSTLLSRVRKTGYIRGRWSLGENIAWGSGALATPQAIVNGWMHSPGHRANILHGAFRDIGIGIRLGAPGQGLSGGATYVTDFGRHG